MNKGFAAVSSGNLGTCNNLPKRFLSSAKKQHTPFKAYSAGNRDGVAPCKSDSSSRVHAPRSVEHLKTSACRVLHPRPLP